METSPGRCHSCRQTVGSRGQKLRNEHLVSTAEAERVAGEAESKRAAAENLRAAVDRLEPELQVRERDREVKLNELEGEAARLEAQLAESNEVIKRLEYDRERRQIRAPISGRIGDCAVLHSGSHVAEGQQIGVIVGGGALQVVADFPPSSAVGKILPGQLATVRLTGFPWAQYGTVPAKVSRVANEIRDGRMRVELAVDRSSNSRIPLQHGLPGSVEVAVERVTPFSMLLRSIGGLAGAH